MRGERRGEGDSVSLSLTHTKKKLQAIGKMVALPNRETKQTNKQIIRFPPLFI